jgi:hypothetical protein
MSLITDDHNGTSLPFPFVGQAIITLAVLGIFRGSLIVHITNIAVPVHLEVFLQLIGPNTQGFLRTNNENNVRFNFIYHSDGAEALPCALLEKKREAAVVDCSSNGFTLITPESCL